MASSTHADSRDTPSGKLEVEAASTALSRDSPSKQPSHPLLDGDGRLSSAGAATALRYARPQDLPSFPSAGLKLASAGAAASIADRQKKPFELWQPGSIPAANKAAYLAKDYEMDPLWQPDSVSSAGSKAANQAHKEEPPKAIMDREVPPEIKSKALLAATASMSGSRRRAESAPLRPQQKGSSWAMKAANNSHKGGAFGSGDPGFEAARIQNMAQNSHTRKMYGSNPPVDIEVQERNHQASLKASAIAMAKVMYAIQQTHLDEAQGSKGRKPHKRTTSDSSNVGDEGVSTPQYNKGGLEEAARKLAQERLAKLQDPNAQYREYYGQSMPQRGRMAMRFRRRASSDGQAVPEEDDDEAAAKIRSQMSIFQSKYDSIDAQKRQSDRNALLEAAAKNVRDRMAAMDEKVFQETGLSGPHLREKWEKEALEKAQKDSDDRMVNHGKVHLGGGRYMDQSEVEAIARARLQPTLDDLTEKAEAQRAQDEAVRKEELRIKNEAEAEKTRIAMEKAEKRAVEKKEKAEGKQLQAEAKARAKAEMLAEKEKRRLEKDERRKEKTAATNGEGAFGVVSTGGFGGASADGTGVVGEEGTPAYFAVTEPRTADDDEDLGPDETRAETKIASRDKDADEEDDDDDEDDADEEEEEDAKKGEDGATEAKLLSSTPGEVGLEGGDKEGAHESAYHAVTMNDGERQTIPESAQGPTLIATTSATKTDNKVKSWFKSRFRSGSKSQKEDEKLTTVPEYSLIKPVEEEKTGEEPEEEKVASDSMRDVAMAGRKDSEETDDMYGSSKNPEQDDENDKDKLQVKGGSIDSVSQYSKDVSKQHPTKEAHDDTNNDPPRGRPGFEARQANSENPASGEIDEAEDAEEARDKFDENHVTPSKAMNAAAGAATTGTETETVSPKGSHDRSKFTENL